MKITRVWAMPSKHTFLIKPIAQLINKYVGDGKNWIDPFAGENSPVEITNDININKPTIYHLSAEQFVSELKGRFKGILFDPPYSLRQTKECYESAGIDFMQKDSQQAVHFGKVKDISKNLILQGGIAICCGWNSNGFGKKRGFELIEILLVCHGGNGHNDTIVTVERKNNTLF
jgi:hypothetical protein